MAADKVTTLGDESKLRKRVPLFRGLFQYFPAALAGVAKLSDIGNRQHNLGEELFHDRAKSKDEADALLRHLMDLSERGGFDQYGNPQVFFIAWRALSLAQKWCEEMQGAPPAPAARHDLKRPLEGTGL